ncbi:unnamed protein product [Lactuca virosa]|uniref:Uncharacterized protein n=1 Tax=Lactuca virosa TaxID=75947 RepID=A0AAU9NRG6_9ASTR|nr:unnamed protein product [Lactuca virosa]
MVVKPDDVTNVATAENEETNTKNMTQGQSSYYTRKENADDVDQLVNVYFLIDPPHVSLQWVPTVKSHAEEIHKLDITVNTSNVDKNITTLETTLTSVPLFDDCYSTIDFYY